MYSDENYFLTKIKKVELDKLTDGNINNLHSAIASADSMINSYLKGITTVPLVNPPEIIKQLSYDIAIFELHDRIQYADIPERIKAKYDAAIFYLKDIARGQANLPNLETIEILEGINYESNNNIFSRNSI